MSQPAAWNEQRVQEMVANHGDQTSDAWPMQDGDLIRFELPSYKGCEGIIEDVDDEGLFWGTASGQGWTVVFRGRTLNEAIGEFPKAVDDYLSRKGP